MTQTSSNIVTLLWVSYQLGYKSFNYHLARGNEASLDDISILSWS